MSDQFVEALVREMNLLRSQLDEARAQCLRHVAELAKVKADMRVMWGWGDPCDMTVSDEVVWNKYHDPNGNGFRLPHDAAPSQGHMDEPSGLRTMEGKSLLPAAPEAGPKEGSIRIRCTACRRDIGLCTCGGVQQSPAQPEVKP
jgi:hypothetical protein